MVGQPITPAHLTRPLRTTAPGLGTAAMTIRTFQAGDDAVQVSIYNEAAAELPKFKPANLDEVRRRGLDPNYDPKCRFIAVDDGGRPVAYAAFQASGRISFPWCRKGHEANAVPLLEHVLEAMRGRGHTSAWSAYRADWTPQRDFLTAHGFVQVREMINYVMDLAEMPTPAARIGTAVTPMLPDDVPALLRIAPKVP